MVQFYHATSSSIYISVDEPQVSLKMWLFILLWPFYYS